MLRTCRVIASQLLFIAVSGCGGSDTPSFDVGGSITGLTEGGLSLSVGSDTITLAAGATSFRFPQIVKSGASYTVVLKTSPAEQICRVENAMGVAIANVSDVQVYCIATYSIGGSIYGLTDRGLTLASFINAGQMGTTDTVSPAAGATSFTFPMRWEDQVQLSVYVQTQPAKQFCAVSDGIRNIDAASINDVQVGCVSGQWTWVNGTSEVGVPGIYGTLGVPSPTNMPGYRAHAMGWKGNAGNFWLYGGQTAPGIAPGSSAAGILGDLWKYAPGTNEWTWVGGSSSMGAAPPVYGTQGMPAPGNYPGGRERSATWTDASGHFWLFGGMSSDILSTELNDLWEYNPETNQWTWMSGSSASFSLSVYGTLGVAAPDNVPGARTGAATWVDTAGNLWLFGGYTLGDQVVTTDPTGNSYTYPDAGTLNDLWKFNPTTRQWTWMGGSNMPAAAADYGEKGVAAASNVPGARSEAIGWVDNVGTFWLYGGTAQLGYDSLQDFWKYVPATGQWTWVGGTQAGDTSQPPTHYTILGVEDPVNTPGPHSGSLSWADPSNNLWLYGGSTPDGNFADLWRFNISTNAWTLMGSNGINATYGTEGAPSASNWPGNLYNGASWVDDAGSLWLLGSPGGVGSDNGGLLVGGTTLWKYTPHPVD